MIIWPLRGHYQMVLRGHYDVPEGPCGATMMAPSGSCTRSRNEKHVKTTKIYIFVRMKFMIPKIAQRSFSRFPSGKIEIELIL